jgi:phospholipase C
MSMSYRKLVMLPACLLLSAVAPFECTPQLSDWGFEKIEELQTPADPPLQCGFSLPADTMAAQRQACAFERGALSAQSLNLSATDANQIPIRHVIFMMKENRTFDHLLGRIHDEGQPEAEAIPADFTNPDLDGNEVAPFHATTTCIPFNPGHQGVEMVRGIAGGTMRGWVQSAAETTGTDGHFAMAYNDSRDLPFYYWLANTYALSDRHFAPMASGTFGNRNFYLFGTNAGVRDTGITFPDPSTPSVLQTLMNAGFTWRAYSDDEVFAGTLRWDHKQPGTGTFQDFLDDLDRGTLPNVAFVDAVEDVTDDHPPDNATFKGDLQAGEQWLRQLYTHAAASPQWSRLAIIWTYDEGGGFADHVPPPTACRAAPTPSPFTQMGPRIPLVAISRWAKPHYVSHVVHDHTAITRFIETLFGLPALTARDANSDALMDLFDFSCTQPATPPQPPPEAGTGGCAP